MSYISIAVPYTCMFDSRETEEEWPMTQEQCQKAIVEFQARAFEGRLAEIPGFVADSCSVSINRGHGTGNFRTILGVLCEGMLYRDENYMMNYCESHSDPVECGFYE